MRNETPDSGRGATSASEPHQQQQQAIIDMKPSRSNSNSTTASLPSNEEYQIEHIIIGDDTTTSTTSGADDSAGEAETSALGASGASGADEMISGSETNDDDDLLDELRDRPADLSNLSRPEVASPNATTASTKLRSSNGGDSMSQHKVLRRSLTSESGLLDELQRQQRTDTTTTPSLAHLRHQFINELVHQHLGPGSPRQKSKVLPSSLSPILSSAAAAATMNKRGSIGSGILLNNNHQLEKCDSVSQHRPSIPGSLAAAAAMMGANMNNNFEIKWRSIHLYAKQSKSFTLIDMWRRLRQPFSSWSSSSSISDIKSQHQQQQAAAISAYSTPQLKMRRSVSQQSDSMGLNSRGVPFALTPDLEEFQSLDDYRPILQNVSGSVFSGQLTAVLGPSGVGKSTLLNTLTGRNQLFGIGRVSLLDCSNKRLSVVFVPQWDLLPELLTTLEDLKFTSRLKNPQFTEVEHRHNIQRVTDLLQLNDFLHVRIKNLSGGQARRLSIGRELLGSPDIMICDEPTSGLDANTCKKIIQALRELTEQSDRLLDRPMSIIVTIHQPQQEVYELFHRVYVMALGGRAIYEGPPGDLLPSFLENSALSSIVPPEQLNENPAVVALEVASGEYGQAIIDDLARCHEFLHEQSPFNTPSLFLRSPKQLNKLLQPNSGCPSPSLGAKQAASSPIIGRPYSSATPKLTPRGGGGANNNYHQNQLASSQQWETKSGITNVSYASTYDAELPEPVAPKLKVDKRLRRSVVMKGDFLGQTWTLIRRSWLMATRDKFLMIIRILGFLGVASGTIHIFSEVLNPNDHSCPQYVSEVENLQTFMTETKFRLNGLKGFLQQNVSNQMFMFNILTTVLMLTAALAGLVYPIQLRMFLREHKNGWYSPGSFVASITISELLIDILGPVMLIGITYQLCQQPASLYNWREGAYMLIVILCTLTMKSLSQIVAGFLRNSVEMAVFASCVMVIIPVLTSGLPVAIENYPAWLKPVTYVSFGRWTFEGLAIARYGYDLCPCDPAKIDGFPTNLDEETIPKRLLTLSRNLLNYYTDRDNDTAPITTTTTTTTTTLAPLATGSAGNDTTDDLFSQIVRMASHASNPLIETHEELGDCSSYRSLALIQLRIEDRKLPQIFLILGLSFIILRIVTYFCVKAVIKSSRSNDG